MFARGVPQIYYVGLPAGENDHQAVAESGEGRSINRHNYTIAEVEAAIRRPVVERVLDLVRLRNREPAFSGRLDVTSVDRDAPSDMALGRTSASSRSIWDPGQRRSQHDTVASNTASRRDVSSREPAQ